MTPCPSTYCHFCERTERIDNFHESHRPTCAGKTNTITWFELLATIGQPYFCINRGGGGGGLRWGWVEEMVIYRNLKHPSQHSHWHSFKLPASYLAAYKILFTDGHQSSCTFVYLILRKRGNLWLKKESNNEKKKIFLCTHSILD